MSLKFLKKTDCVKRLQMTAGGGRACHNMPYFAVKNYVNYVQLDSCPSQNPDGFLITIKMKYRSTIDNTDTSIRVPIIFRCNDSNFTAIRFLL